MFKDIKSKKQLMVKSNLRLVISFAKKVFRTKTNLHFLDYIQAGNIGLMRAVDKFDHRMGYKFSTYSCWWIRQSITRLISDQGKLIRVPVHINDLAQKIYKFKSEHKEQGHGDDESIEEISKHLKISAKRIKEISSISKEPISISAPVGTRDSKTEIGDFIPNTEQNPSTEIEQDDLAQSILMVINKTLKEREALVIKMRFGLNNHKAKTLEEVGQTLNVTRERVRQIQAKCLAKLKKSEHIHILMNFLSS